MTEREEESLLDEMREAIRAQRERAAAARVEPPREPPPVPERRKPLLQRLLGR